MSEWSVCQIDDLGEINRGKSKHRPRNDSILFGGKYPFIQTADVKKANLYITEYEATYSDIGLAQSKLWKKGTLCITIAANIAESAILGIDACFPDSVVGFIPFEKKSDIRFVKYLLDEFKVYMQQISKGTTQDNLSLEKLRRVKLRAPNCDVQVKIDNTIAAYDDLIENNNKRIKILEQIAENLYKEWFVRFRFPGHETTPIENGIPHGWEIMVAEDRYNITIGKTPPRKEFEWFTSECENAQNWLSISDMTDIFVGETSEQLTYEAVKRFNMIVVPKDTILLSFKLTVGRVAIAMDKLCTNEAIAHFKNFNEYEREYLFLMLKNYDYNKLGNTSAIGNAINSKIVKAMKLTVPSKSVLKAFHSATKPIFDQISNIMQQNQKLIKQRDLLLPRLMSGKLAV